MRRLNSGERGPVFVVASLGGVLALSLAFWLGRASVGAPAGLASAGPGEPREPAAATSGSSWDLAALGERPAERALPAASRPAPEPPAPAAPAARSDELDAQGRTLDDRAFYDPENRFTVRAIRYANTPNGWQHALGVYRYLREQGLPAIAPIDQGELIVICVGAEPRREGRLAELRQRLEELPGPPPRNERNAFSGAYYDNIDHLIER